MKFEFSTPSAMPLKLSAGADIVGGEKVGQLLVGNVGVNGHGGVRGKGRRPASLPRPGYAAIRRDVQSPRRRLGAARYLRAARDV